MKENILRSRKGFTLVELMIVIVILGILGGLAGPKVFESVKGSRVNATVANMQMVKRAVDQYYAENSSIPDTAAFATTVAPRLSQTMTAMGLDYNATAAMIATMPPTYQIRVINMATIKLNGTDASLFTGKFGALTPTIATGASPYVTVTFTAGQ